MRIIIAVFILHIGILSNKAQIAPGEWRDHLPYRLAERLAFGDNKIFCATSHSLFFYDKTDNSINKLSKVQGLNYNSIDAIEYVTSQKALVIGYSNASIDVLKGNKITNIPYIKNKVNLINKKINNIRTINNEVYLACGYGISVLDLEKNLIQSTYYPGTGSSINEVFDVCSDGSYIYASTRSGIFKGVLGDPFLMDNSHWTLIGSFGSNLKNNYIASFDNKLFTLVSSVPGTMQDSIMVYNGVKWERLNIDKQNIYSISNNSGKLIIAGTYSVLLVEAGLKVSQMGAADPRFGIQDNEKEIWCAEFGSGLANLSKNLTFFPDGPMNPENVKIDIKDNDIWTVCGSLGVSWEWQYNNHGLAAYTNNKWDYYTPYNIENMSNLRDVMNVKINPKNASQVYMASYNSGLLEFNNGDFKLYTSANSIIQEDFYQPGSKLFFTYGLDFDAQGNLWLSNSRAQKPLIVKKRDGSWKSFSLPGFSNNYYLAGSLLVASWGHKWVLSPRSSIIAVFDDNGTIDNTSDDRSKNVKITNVESLVQSNFLYCMVEDREGNIWFGSDAGPIVVSNAQYVFSENGINAYKIKIPLSIEDNTATFLLEQEKINSIAVDGNNRKWIATETSGAYLVSADGTKQITHFTAENSPLLSNNILDIKVHPKTGEVFFATDKGLISFRGYATEGSADFGDVYVFPNPVRENFSGDIIITNLATDADVRITDISGNLVFKTKALGGQAVWDGKNLIGKRVSTGVYLVFCSNEDGSKTFVTKLLFIH